jgi:hypothetical protein
MRDGVSRGEIRADDSVAVMRDAFYGGLEHFARSARLRESQPYTKAEVAQFLTLFMAGIMDRPSAGVLDGVRVIRRLQGVITDIEEQLRAGQQDDVEMQDGEGTQ